MKKFFSIFILLGIIALSKAQDNPFSITCVNEIAERIKTNEINVLSSQKLESISCGNSSAYYNQYSLYKPQASDDIIYIKLNFIFLTKPDGTGNFEQYNAEHEKVIDDMITTANQNLLQLATPSSSDPASCENEGINNLTTTKLQIVVNRVWKVDSAWDYLQTGYDLSCGDPGELDALSTKPDLLL